MLSCYLYDKCYHLSVVDSCRSNPCLNQGACINIMDDYSCLCTEGFNGSTCEIGTCIYICT